MHNIYIGEKKISNIMTDNVIFLTESLFDILYIVNYNYFDWNQSRDGVDTYNGIYCTES
jgi:hypothetical protein